MKLAGLSEHKHDELLDNIQKYKQRNFNFQEGVHLYFGPMDTGVGRTGTFVCIDNVLEQIKKEKAVDIAGAINKMRHQRMRMVNLQVQGTSY